MVSLSAAGAGEVMYTFDTGLRTTPPPLLNGEDGGEPDAMTPQVDDATKEWNNVEITFTWEGGRAAARYGYRDRQLSSRDR